MFLGSKHLLCELGDGDGAEGVCTTTGQRCEANHEEVETREGNHVDSQLPQIRVELTREAQASGNTGHDGGDEVIQVTIGWAV